MKRTLCIFCIVFTVTTLLLEVLGVPHHINRSYDYFVSYCYEAPEGFAWHWRTVTMAQKLAGVSDLNALRNTLCTNAGSTNVVIISIQPLPCP